MTVQDKVAMSACEKENIKSSCWVVPKLDAPDSDAAFINRTPFL